MGLEMASLRNPKLQKRLIVVLLAIFALSALNMMKGLRPRKPAPAQVVQEPTPQAPAVRRDASRPAGPPRSAERPAAAPTYTAHELRDPLQNLLPQEPPPVKAPPEERPPSLAPTVQPPAVTIQGLLWGGHKPQAIIDNQVYQVGDAIQGATIKAIGREGVLIELHGQTVWLAISQEATNRSSPRTP